ncbi:DMSO/TMAO reductase YedYZ molybdopterin-dependent catalytic subunit [Mumia flava]|uniref:DMSO/TMAO reductase YedYZ molybdopterin-dependent catalytic subunit n=1 Tax=Mumia flava TaxID=1348852 RepID=A0A0B2BBV4_9ACTN|nr:molybdopterin-dependent oxidoreductase [Mumia flava]PJJ53950.1 DMSO/TMAO reductase YedYZ molybdopterin-dependent catalytic subunit [Mumia flava]
MTEQTRTTTARADLTPRARRALAALSGVLAAAAGVGAGSATAALTGSPSPVVAVGNSVIERTPEPVKEWAIDWFGTNDKLVLLLGIGVLLAALAAAAGLVALRSRGAAGGLIVLVGVVALAAALTDETTSTRIVLGVLAPLATVVVALWALSALLDALVGPEARPHRPPPSADGLGGRPGPGGPDLPDRVAGDDLPTGFDRRRFLLVAMGTAAAAVAGGATYRLLGTPEAAGSRSALGVPTPDSPAAPVPTGVDPPLDGLPPHITPNADFYRIDTALRVPDVPADSWRLRIHGDVENEIELDYAGLLAERLIERRITLTCVSNEVGGSLVGNATWIGVPLADLLERARPAGGTDALLTTSADGMTIGVPLDAVTDGRDAMLAVAMNGEPLPLEHGFPVRMVVPGLYGYVSATKWLVDIEVTRFDAFDAYWTERGWSEEGPIKLSSRIDVPQATTRFGAGEGVVAGGLAWAQNTGLAAVQVRIDDGEWRDADLAPEDTADTWRQWTWRWDSPEPGDHTLTVRAVDADGQSQETAEADPAPDGATGLHAIEFTVE